MAGMWVVRGEVGSLYEAFRERGVAAVGWTGHTCQAWRRTYAVDRSLPVRRTPGETRDGYLGRISILAVRQ